MKNRFLRIAFAVAIAALFSQYLAAYDVVAVSVCFTPVILQSSCTPGNWITRLP